MEQFRPTAEQEAAINARGRSLLVSAAAGSGKTRVLVERLMAYLTQDGEAISSFLVITYTKAAATELRGKIIEELTKRIAADPKNRHLQRQATLVYQAEIKTIHGFCTGLLRAHGPLLGLDPEFRVADEGESQILMRQALERVLEEKYEGAEEADPFFTLVDTLSAGRDDSKLMEIVLDTYEKVQSHPYPDRWFADRLGELREETSDAGETPWGQLILAHLRQQCRFWRGEMAGALALLQEDEDLAKGYQESFAETISSLEGLLEAVAGGWDAVWRRGPVSFPRLKGARGVQNKLIQEQVKEIRDRCKKRMEKALAPFLSSSDVLLSDLQRVAPLEEALFSLTMEFEEMYQREKTRRRLVDFHDLEHRTVSALLDPETGEATPLARETGQRYREILVDEYQDANAVQNAIFEALSQEGKNLFFVGDVKQSIYRFRLADPTLFLERYRSFAPYDQAAEGEGGKLILSKNFRSRAQVLHGVNFVFSGLMSRAFGEMDYGPEEMLYPGAAYPETGESCVELCVLDLQQEEMKEDEERPAQTEMEARGVADRILGLLAQGSEVFDKELGQMRPVTSGDIVILLRSHTAALPYYARALGERGISCAIESAEGFLDAVEVSTAVAALTILDNPRQDVPLISVLRSPLFGFSADLLAEIRMCAPGGDFYAALEEAAEKIVPCRDFLDALNDLRQKAVDLPADLLLWQMYTQWNFLAVFGALPGGEMRQENLVTLYLHAQRLAQNGRQSLFSLVQYIARLKETGGDLAAPGDVSGSGVRIMSIHKSKGLEFPVVILAGLSKRFNRMDLRKPILVHPRLGLGPKLLKLEEMTEYPTLPRWAVERQLESELLSEELRLLYVAMTRAKEKLILFCAMANGERALSAMALDARYPMEPQALMQANSMAQWLLPLLMTRPDGGALRALAQREDLPLQRDPGPAWDIRVTRPGEEALAPLAREEEEAAQPEDALPPLDMTPYPYLEAANTPSKVTATSLKGRAIDAEAAENTPKRRETKGFLRPRFITEAEGLTPAEQGTALHLAMQFIDFHSAGSVAEIREALEGMVARELLTRQQADAVSPEKIRTFFASKLGKELLEADSLRREFKFSVLVPAELYFPGALEQEHVLLQGVVDCFWEGAQGLTILDFKTDYVPHGQAAEKGEQYRPQMEAYETALFQVTGKRASRKILYFFSIGQGVLVEKDGCCLLS